MTEESKDCHINERRLAIEYMNTGDLSRKIDEVLDNRYVAPVAKKTGFWQKLKERIKT